MSRPSLPVNRPPRLAWLITLPLFALTMGITIPLAAADQHLAKNIEYWPVFIVLFVISGINLLRFDIRRQAINVSMTDVPLLLGLYYLSPSGLMVSASCAAVITQILQRSTVVKAVFNVAVVSAGTACANLVVFLLGIDGIGPRTWVVLAVAVLAHVYMTLLAVIGVITLMQGMAQTRQVKRSAGFGIMVTIINIVVGLVIVLALEADGWAALLLIGLAGLVGMVYRAYAQFLRQHRSLAEMYELTQALAATGQDGTLFDVLLARVGRVMQSESATLWLPQQGRHPEVLLSARADYPGLLDDAITPNALRAYAIETGQTLVVSAKTGPDDLRVQLNEADVKDAIVVPLRSGSVVVGTLEVAGRLGDQTSFGPDDVRLVETLAAHAAVAVENARLVDRLRFDASHDLLTGLPNRQRMLEALSTAIEAPAVDDVVAVLLFDVVDLRQVNESLGQASGDEVLVEVATRLRRLAPAGAMLARVGGDEFVLEMRASGTETAFAMAESIQEALRDRIVVDALTVDIDTSVGITIYPDHGDNAELLLRRAEVAAHVAKRRTAIQLFGQGLESRSARRLGLAADLREALDAGSLEVYFQPKVSILDRKVVGVECLARWDHPIHGAVAPQDVVAVAEHTGELSRLTEFVLREGLGRATTWGRQEQTLSVSVNIAVRTLLDASFPDLVRQLLGEYAVPPERLILEITEEAMVADTERPLPTLHRLHDLGVRLSVDDFGTGYSSLAYLRRLPIDEIKVDRSFVQGMTTDSRDLSVVRAIVDMARHFGLTAVAEGVESELTLGVLEDIGCDIGQGFLFSRPLPNDRLDTWLRGQADTSGVPAGEVRWLKVVP